MKNKVLVSAIIPSRDRKVFLVNAINSVQKQTYPVHEIIVVDDYSYYDVDTYLNSVFNRGKGIPIIVKRNQRRRGAAVSRNIGVKYSKGDFVAFLDSDDCWLPDKIEKQMDIYYNNEMVELVYCDHYTLYNGDLINSDKILHDRNIWKNLLEGWFAFPNTSSLLINKEIFLYINGFSSDLKSCQDHDLWMKIGMHGINVKYVKESLYVININAINRISLNYWDRVNGVDSFFSKWSEDIVKHGGINNYRSFRNKYFVAAFFDIFVLSVMNFKFFISFHIFIYRFIKNQNFYRKVVERLKCYIYSNN